MNRILAIVIAVLAVTGCMTTKPNYSFNASPDDPVLIFNSDFELHTLFSVNTDPASNNSCKKFVLAGYILHKDSIFIYDTPNKEFQIKVPSGQAITVRAFHNYSDPNQYSICGPLLASFTPQTGKTYRVTMHEIGQKNNSSKNSTMCTLSIRDISASPSPVNATPIKTCNKN